MSSIYRIYIDYMPYINNSKIYILLTKHYSDIFRI